MAQLKTDVDVTEEGKAVAVSKDGRFTVIYGPPRDDKDSGSHFHLYDTKRKDNPTTEQEADGYVQSFRDKAAAVAEMDVIVREEAAYGAGLEAGTSEAKAARDAFESATVGADISESSKSKK